MKADNAASAHERLLRTVDEAANRLGLGQTKVYELIGRGELASVRIGSARRIPASALAEYLKRLVSEQSADTQVG